MVLFCLGCVVAARRMVGAVFPVIALLKKRGRMVGYPLLLLKAAVVLLRLPQRLAGGFPLLPARIIDTFGLVDILQGLDVDLIARMQRATHQAPDEEIPVRLNKRTKTATAFC
jgi:hypothetical protein